MINPKCLQCRGHIATGCNRICICMRCLDKVVVRQISNLDHWAPHAARAYANSIVGCVFNLGQHTCIEELCYSVMAAGQNKKNPSSAQNNTHFASHVASYTALWACFLIARKYCREMLLSGYKLGAPSRGGI